MKITLDKVRAIKYVVDKTPTNPTHLPRHRILPFTSPAQHRNPLLHSDRKSYTHAQHRMSLKRYRIGQNYRPKSWRLLERQKRGHRRVASHSTDVSKLPTSAVLMILTFIVVIESACAMASRTILPVLLVCCIAFKMAQCAAPEPNFYTPIS